MTTTPPFEFSVVSGDAAHEVVRSNISRIVDLVAEAYRAHGAGQTVNPASQFLRFPDRPNARIIALPAFLGGPTPACGLKWIASYPENIRRGVPRASAVLILNDPETGYPFACLESSIISAARTAASAALAAVELSTRRGVKPARVGFVGVGIIARYIHTYLVGNGLEFEALGIHDLSASHAAGFAEYLGRTEAGSITVHDTAEELITDSDLIVFATVAGEPHVQDPAWFAHNPLVLHVSLRDLSPEIILGAYNVVDDIEHCMKANTSPHLAEQLVGHRDFVAGTLYDVLTDKTTPPADKPVIFSPFGLGVLDLAVAKYVYDQVTATGDLLTVPDFFHELKRYG
jgi:2,3-diaminopropionate biosynthesis protein SbnB